MSRNPDTAPVRSVLVAGGTECPPQVSQLQVGVHWCDSLDSTLADIQFMSVRPVPSGDPVSTWLGVLPMFCFKRCNIR